MIPQFRKLGDTMNQIKQLQELLQKDVLVEVDESIQEIEKYIQENKKNKAEKEQLKYIKDVKIYFNEVLQDIKLGNLSEEQAIDILEGLEDMKTEN